MGAENEFSKRVRRALRQAGCAVYPVETGGTVSGFPDLVVSHKGGASFVELKSRRSMLVRQLADKALEGPGQRTFARQLFRKTAYRTGGFSVSKRSFLLVECMDGVALMAEEESGAYLAACWEGLPSGEDLRDALRAWGVAVIPLVEAEHGSARETLENCALIYETCTGICPLMGGQDEDSLHDAMNREDAILMARDICDRGRYALLMASMEGDKEGYCAPIEGGNGFVVLSKEDK